jgi:hypothetical protein
MSGTEHTVWGLIDESCSRRELSCSSWLIGDCGTLRLFAAYINSAALVCEIAPEANQQSLRYYEDRYFLHRCVRS